MDEIVEFVIKNIPGKTFVDVGAYIGEFCVPLMQHYERCIAFEPNPYVIEILRENTRHLDVTIRKEALLNASGWGVLKVPLDAQMSMATLGTPRRYKQWKHVTVPVTTLDKLGLTDIDLLKIDAEGAELHILQGGVEFLKRERPVVVLELQTRNLRQFKVKKEQVLAFLQSLGYRIESATQRDVVAWPK